MDEDSLSMVDVLEEQSRMQDDATAVLGDSDEQNCTYPLGYVQRQALYACSTCSNTEPAGICLACSYICHEGHDLYELYTKRHFRCDCGNNKFGQNKCKLVPTKDVTNPENKYNQNFRGTYCTCSRPYPDPDDEVEDDMIQCVVCEDWYHGRHLGLEVPDNENFEEMTCPKCMDKHSFLWAYQIGGETVTVKNESAEDKEVKVGVNGEVKEVKVEVNGEDKEVKVEMNGEDKEVKVEVNGEDKEVKVEVNGEDKEVKAEVNGDSYEKSEATGESSQETTKVKEELAAQSENSESDQSEPPAKRLKTEDDAGEDKGKTETCFLEDIQKREFVSKSCGAFWAGRWRDKLCRCSKCLSLYKKEGVEFLLDARDTVHAYEERGRGKNPTLSESEIEQNALSQMSHVQKIEVVQGFNDMKTELREYLRGFADSGKVVGADDIKAFFADLEKKKKKRLGVPQFHCK